VGKAGRPIAEVGQTISYLVSVGETVAVKIV